MPMRENDRVRGVKGQAVRGGGLWMVLVRYKYITPQRAEIEIETEEWSGIRFGDRKTP